MLNAQIGGGVKAGSTYRITTQGNLTPTSNRYDLAIEGRGFLQVLMPSGETSGVLTFAAGETEKTISITLRGDTKYEADETFSVVLGALSEGLWRGPSTATAHSRSVRRG